MSAKTRAPTRRRAKSAPGQPLSRELIADAAVELVDREGLEALSMRRLAAELGIGTMTIYGYFRDKDELLDFSIDRMARRYELPSEEGDWRRRLRELITTMYGSLLEHPSTVQLRSRRPILNPGALRAGEAGMAILADAGLELNEAAGAWRLLFTYIFGYAAFSAQEPTPELKREWAEQLGALPEEEYPVLSRASEQLAGWMAGREPFEEGLELILDGIEARVAKGG
jgi:AcrR family transcriptional regulator